MFSEERWLKLIYGQEVRQTELLETIVRLLIEEVKHEVRYFVISQVSETGEEMPIQGIAPGSTGQFSAQPVDKNGNNDSLPAGVVPVWTSSDPTNAPVTASADGMSASVTVGDGATPGSTFTLSVSATLQDGTTPSGSASVPIFALEVASFVINQTA